MWEWVIIWCLAVFGLFVVLSHSTWWTGEDNYKKLARDIEREKRRREAQEKREQDRLKRVNGGCCD